MTSTPIHALSSRKYWTAFLHYAMLVFMGTRDEAADVTVQTKITATDSRRLDLEVERLKLLNPAGEFTRSSILRAALYEWLQDAPEYVWDPDFVSKVRRA